MRSKWFELKSSAIRLRKQGNSIRDIEKKLGIPRSTLSGWFTNVPLSSHKQKIMEKRKSEALVKARAKAVLWHNNQKQLHMQVAETAANTTLSAIKKSGQILELALALLYLGEGAKKDAATSMGNSDPLIVKFFLEILRKVYMVEESKIKIYLHLRADQDPLQMQMFWRNELQIPITQFGKISIDKRTFGTSTYKHYNGVCVVSCGSVAIQRKLVYIGRKFCEKAIKDMRD